MKEFEYKGYKCMLQAPHGYYCGYIDLPKGHPWHKYDDYWEKPISEIPFHGGCTYIELEEDGSRRIGFDCAHAGDLVPLPASFGSWDRPVFRDADYVTQNLKEAVDYIEEEIQKGSSDKQGRVNSDD